MGVLWCVGPRRPAIRNSWTCTGAELSERPTTEINLRNTIARQPAITVRQRNTVGTDREHDGELQQDLHHALCTMHPCSFKHYATEDSVVWVQAVVAGSCAMTVEGVAADAIRFSQVVKAT